MVPANSQGGVGGCGRGLWGLKSPQGEACGCINTMGYYSAVKKRERQGWITEPKKSVHLACRAGLLSKSGRRGQDGGYRGSRSVLAGREHESL